jgi:hypothetical protein
VKDINKAFCRMVLTLTMKDLTGREADHFKANVGVVGIGRGDYFVEWPEMGADGTFEFECRADNVEDAKSQALNNWLEYHAVKVRAKGYPPRKPK